MGPAPRRPRRAPRHHPHRRRRHRPRHRAQPPPKPPKSRGIRTLGDRSRQIRSCPVVTGVRLDDGTELAADLVVAANGRRSAVAEWLADIGARPVTETVEDTGIVYASRFYRLLPDADLPPRTGPIGGDLGYVKYGTFVGRQPHVLDHARRAVRRRRTPPPPRDPVAFDAAARTLARDRTVARRPRRADHARRPRDGRIAQQVERLRRGRSTDGRSDSSRSVMPCCARTRCTDGGAARPTGAPIC